MYRLILIPGPSSQALAEHYNVASDSVPEASLDIQSNSVSYPFNPFETVGIVGIVVGLGAVAALLAGRKHE